MTVADVAALLQLSEKSVYRLAQRGGLPGFKAGGSWRFRHRDIDGWAAELVKGKQKGKRLFMSRILLNTPNRAAGSKSDTDPWVRAGDGTPLEADQEPKPGND